MTMRIMLTGDVHLHEPLGREEQERYLDHIVLATDGVDALFIQGDLVRPACADRMSVWERNTWRRFLRATKCRTIILRGNHDVPGDAAHFADLPTAEFYEGPARIEVGQLHVGILPWQELGADIPAALEFLRGPGPSFLSAHAMIGGATKANGQPLASDEVSIPLELLGGWDLVSASHVHAAQTFEGPSGPVVLPGSPWPHRADEGAQWGKGPQIWRLEQAPSGAWTAHLERIVVVPYVPRMQARLVWSADARRLEWADGRPWEGRPDLPSGESVMGARVAVAVLRPSAAAAAVRKTEIEAAFLAAGAAGAVVTVSPMHEDRPRCPEVARPSLTLWEQLQAVREAEGRPLSAAELPRWQAEIAHIQQTINARAARSAA